MLELNYNNNNHILPLAIIKQIKHDDNQIKKMSTGSFSQEPFSPKTHYLKLADSNYYFALITLRHYIKVASDYFFGVEQKAKNIDLFMLTSSISSPMGPGSDSKPINIKFGKLKTCLTDSSQFGFEPLLLNKFKKVYCYLPSMRGEDCDARHLSQFFHCELEIRGGLNNLIPIIEKYIKFLCRVILTMDQTIEKIAVKPSTSKKILKDTINIKKFPAITFDKAVDLLIKNGFKNLVHTTKHGRDISSQGEIQLMKLLKIKTPLWITHFDRDRVPFYQKPNPKNKNETINADLLFPPVIKNSFGGEVVGASQRQDNVKEIHESLKRQKHINAEPYEWYINLRRQKNYQTTSGFGMGIERFIAWALGKSDIKDVIPYPRIKNTRSYP